MLYENVNALDRIIYNPSVQQSFVRESSLLLDIFFCRSNFGTVVERLFSPLHTKELRGLRATNLKVLHWQMLGKSVRIEFITITGAVIKWDFELECILGFGAACKL